MDNYTPQELLNFWQKGKTLNEAITAFADPECIPEYMRVPMHEIKPDENALMGSIVSGLETLSQLSLQQGKLLENIYQQLKRGDLIAIGHELPMKSSDPLVMIPPSMWPPEKSHRGKSTVLSNGVNFGSVRIISKTHLTPLLEAPKLIAPAIKSLPKFETKNTKMGRPSLEKIILEAYEALKKDGQIDYSKSQAHHVPIVKKAILHLYPELKDSPGLGREAIRNKIAPLFNSGKAAQKVTQKV